MRLFAVTLVWLLLGLSWAEAQTNIPPSTLVQQSGQRLDASIQVQHTHAASTTLTATPPSGQYVYWTGMDLSLCSDATGFTAAAPLYVTTTGFSGSPQYQVGGATAGVCYDAQPGGMSYLAPLKSTTAGTAVTWVTPAVVAHQIVSLNVYYYFAP